MRGAQCVHSYGRHWQQPRRLLVNTDVTAGIVACGLAPPSVPLNFARKVFAIEQRGLQALLLYPCCLASAQRYGSFSVFPYPSISEATICMCALWSGNLHLDVEDVGVMSAAFPRLRRYDNHLRSSRSF